MTSVDNADSSSTPADNLTEGSVTFACPPASLTLMEDTAGSRSSVLSPRCLRCLRVGSSVLCHIGVLVSTVVLLLSSTTELSGTVSACMGLLLAIFYLILLTEAGFSNTRVYLRHFSTSLSAEAYVERVRDARPMVRWIAMCYHYEEDEVHASQPAKERLQPNEYVSNVGLHAKSKGERIMSCKEMEAFRFTGWRDHTSVTLPQANTILRLQCSKIFRFHDDAAKHEYEEQQQAFREMSRRKDEFMLHQEEMLLPVFQESVLVCCGGASRPWWMYEAAFWISTVIMLSWPYRIIFSKLTTPITITFIKELQV